MPDDLVLAERTSVVVPSERLGEGALQALALAPPYLLRVRRVLGGHEIRTGSVTGMLELEGSVRIRMEPRLLPDGAAVLDWLAYASGVPVEVQHTRTWQVGSNGLRDLVVAALIAECARLARAGLRLDYRREQAVDTVLRGRLDVRAQMTRRYGQIDQLHLDRFARHADVWENVVCGVALGVAARTAGTLTLRQAARGLAGVFPQGTVDRGWARRRMRGAHYHRLNVRYRPAHLWASVLLGGGGIDDFLAEGPWSAGSLLVRTDRIWERAVARACADVDGASAVVTPALPSIRVSEPGAATRVFRPDASVVLPGSVRTPVDAKYKDYAADQVGRDDVHQLLTYAAAAAPSGTDPTAILVHPVVGNPTRRALEVRTGRRLVGRIIAVGLDTRRPPAHSVERLADVLREPVPV